MLTAKEPVKFDVRQDALARKGVFQLGPVVFKLAESPHEIEQVHRLNYQAFVREVPQHSDPGSDCLIDKFHDKNVYFIALRNEQVVGMVSAHDRPPFSVCDRLKDPQAIDRLGGRPLEVRLLAIEPTQRCSIVFAGLMGALWEYAQARRYTHVLISGLVQRRSMYERMGFRPLGPAVRSGQADFVPMVLDLRDLPANVVRGLRWLGSRTAQEPAQPICLLPGPVQVSPAVREAFLLPPVSHRSREFLDIFERVRVLLSQLAGGMDVALLCGTGTLANDAVAATLAADPTISAGLLLVNGEFGNRLVGQASRFGLRFRTLSWPWGLPWDLDQVADSLAKNPDINWIWGVHLESSTGTLNDLPGLLRLVRGRRVRVCADCISSVGAVSLELSDIHLATGASGKSLGALAGLAMVFAAPGVLAAVAADRLPAYLDLPATLATTGARFTFPSPLLRALGSALEGYSTPASRQQRYQHYQNLGRYVRGQLRALGLPPLVSEEWAAPVLTTFTPLPHEAPDRFRERCRDWGYELAGQSSYLNQRGWLQIATMGEISKEDCAPFFDKLAGWLRDREQHGPASSAASGCIKNA